MVSVKAYKICYLILLLPYLCISIKLAKNKKTMKLTLIKLLILLVLWFSSYKKN